MLTYRTVKGTPLTFDELDENFRHLDESKADAESLAASGGAGLVGCGIRTVEDRAEDTLSVRDRITTAIDGVTSNQAGIADAVAEAYANGLALEWPAGTYISDANIPNFHDVTHIGKGIIKRGADLFAVAPKDGNTNTLYVSPAGSNANDGLSALQPKATLQSAIDALDNYRPVLLGTWKIKGAAGTYTRGRFADEGLPSQNPIVIEGPDVGGHPNVPTMLIKEGATQVAVGIAVFRNTSILARNILFEDFNGSDASAGIFGSESRIFTENCHFRDCYYGVTSGGAGSVVNLKGGILDDCGYLNSVTAGGYAIRGLFHVKFEIGTQEAGTLANGPIIRNCSGALRGQELCTGHFDWVTVEDNASGIRLSINSRLNVDGASFKRNGSSAIYATGGSYGDCTANTVFGSGVDANTRNYSVGQGSMAGNSAISGLTLTNAADAHSFKTAFPNTVVTSISSANTIDSNVLIGGAFSGASVSSIPAKKVTLVVKGTLSGSTGAYKRVALRLGAASIVFASFSAAHLGAFEARLEVQFISTGNQLLSSIGIASGGGVYVANTAAAVDMSVDQTLAFQAYVENAADSITITSYEWSVQGV